MSLAILHTEASCGWGGQEIRILTEMTALQARGHRVHLLTPAHAGICAAAKARGLSVDALPIEFRRPRGYFALWRWMRRHGAAFDVCNTHSSADSWLTALVRSGLGHTRVPPIVRTRHVSTPINRSRTTRWLYRRATAHIVVTGEALKRQLVRNNQIDPSHITSVRTGIDLARFRSLDRSAMRVRHGVDARPAIAIVATLRDWKGHDDLLDVWMSLRLHVPGWQMLIIGDGPRRDHLQARVTAAQLADEVRFTGNQEAVEEWLACADIVVLPSWGEEGVPQSLMQAAACARPAVSTAVGAIEEAVIHQKTGLIVPPREPAALRAALERLMRDASLRATMGAAGRGYAEAHFGVEAMADAMEAVFTRVIGGSR